VITDNMVVIIKISVSTKTSALSCWSRYWIDVCWVCGSFGSTQYWTCWPCSQGCGHKLISGYLSSLKSSSLFAKPFAQIGKISGSVYRKIHWRKWSPLRVSGDGLPDQFGGNVWF